MPVTPRYRRACQDRFVHEEGNPFPGFTMVGGGAAVQFDAAIPERDEPGLAEAGDEIPETEGGRTGNERFGFHNAPILP